MRKKVLDPEIHRSPQRGEEQVTDQEIQEAMKAIPEFRQSVAKNTLIARNHRRQLRAQGKNIEISYKIVTHTCVKSQTVYVIFLNQFLTNFH